MTLSRVMAVPFPTNDIFVLQNFVSLKFNQNSNLVKNDSKEIGFPRNISGDCKLTCSVFNDELGRGEKEGRLLTFRLETEGAARQTGHVPDTTRSPAAAGRKVSLGRKVCKESVTGPFLYQTFHKTL